MKINFWFIFAAWATVLHNCMSFFVNYTHTHTYAGTYTVNCLIARLPGRQTRRTQLATVDEFCKLLHTCSCCCCCLSPLGCLMHVPHSLLPFKNVLQKEKLTVTCSDLSLIFKKLFNMQRKLSNSSDIPTHQLCHFFF